MSVNPDVEPKPFFWIPLQGTPERKVPVFHEAFRGWTGWLVLDIEVYSDYLYVGSGQIGLVHINGREQARYTFTRRDGKLVIPATSIKGAVRSVFEAITNSCVSQRHRRERPPSTTHMACGLVRKGKEDRAQLCPACRVFGTTGYRGRVHFTDGEPVDSVRTTTIKISDLWPPRHFQGRKFYETKKYQPQDLEPARNTRFIEVVPKGSKFRATLHFENLNEGELGALLRALGVVPKEKDPDEVRLAFPIKLGGAKPRCLGSVYMCPRKVRIVASPQQSWLAGLLQPSGRGELLTLLAAWLRNTTLLDMQAWETFQAQAQPRTDEPCPREVY
ncbi:MAG: hypothetical protein DRO01_00700 [Thermoproteota archaeon]|nr:MAG: hypothetical protein DRO01_00700 [Candidatus Korarchaeota archaeon]